MKKYVIIAGVNGAGKSTLYQTLDSLQNMPRVNTDEIVKEIGSWKNPVDVMEAGKIAVKMIREYFDQGISFNQETTLCGKSIINNIIKAKLLGYDIELHYVGVDSVDIAKKRIAHRVLCGGHDIPEKDVERRYVESLKGLVKAMSLCDLIIMYDNTNAFERFAVYENGKLKVISETYPRWYRDLIDNLTSNYV